MCFGSSRLSPATGTAGIFSFLSNSVYTKLTTLGDPMMNQEMALSSQVGRGSCMRSALSIQPCKSFPMCRPSCTLFLLGGRAAMEGEQLLLQAPGISVCWKLQSPLGCAKGSPGNGAGVGGTASSGSQFVSWISRGVWSIVHWPHRVGPLVYRFGKKTKETISPLKVANLYELKSCSNELSR